MADSGKNRVGHFLSGSILRLAALPGQAHLDMVFLTVVNQGNIVIELFDAINGHLSLALLGRGALDEQILNRKRKLRTSGVFVK